MGTVRKGKRIFVLVITVFAAISMLGFFTEPAWVSAASNRESEENDSFETADRVYVNTTYTGSISDYSDYDYYWFALSQSGVVTLDFNHRNLDNPSTYWTICLYDSDKDKIVESEVIGYGTSHRISQIGLPAGNYYIRITDASLTSSSNYNFNIKFSPSAVWEKENNDDKTTATSTRIGTRYYGNLIHKWDYDYYWFPVSKRTKLKLNFQHGRVSSASDCWEINIWKADDSWEFDEYYRSKGNQTSMTAHMGYLPAGNYYILVTSDDIYSAANYSFLISADTAAPKKTVKVQPPAKTKMISVKAGKRKAVLRWKKVGSAKGYQIYRATKKKGNYKRIKTITKNKTVKFTNRKLKKGKRYYYKIRTYKIVGGKKYYSGFTKVRSVRAR